MALQNTPDSSQANIVQYRIERGAAAIGTDGPLGSVEQIVVDRESGELRALIVRSGDGGSEFELPAEHVRSATGDQVHLDIGSADMATRPDLATPYDPSQYVPVYQGETNSPSEASRTALDTEHPVVTEVEDDAAEIVAPQPTTSDAPTDTAAGNAASWTPRSETVEGAGDSATAVDEAVTEPRVTPVQSQSATPSTTGPLVGGKPSTSGMGEKSAVPRSDEAPYNEPPTPPGTAYPAPDQGMVQAFREAGSDPDTIAKNLESEDTAPTTPMPRATTDSTATASPLSMRAEPIVQPAVTSSTAPVTPVDTAGPDPISDAASIKTQIPETAASIERAPLSEMLPLPVLIAAGALAAGVIGGIAWRRQTTKTNQARSTARKATNALQDLLGNAGESASDATKTAQQAAKTTKRVAKRARRRGSWFTRGLLVGAGLAILYAPDSGERLRLQLNSAANRLLRRAS